MRVGVFDRVRVGEGEYVGELVLAKVGVEVLEGELEGEGESVWE